MAFRKITEGDMLGKGNVGRPDTPGVSTAEMQRIMDELPREVLAPAFNELAGQLEAETAAADIGAAAPEGVTAAPIIFIYKCANLIAFIAKINMLCI